MIELYNLTPDELEDHLYEMIKAAELGPTKEEFTLNELAWTFAEAPELFIVFKELVERHK